MAQSPQDSLAAPGPVSPGSPIGGASLAATVLAALGIVYGDIGTSPLYALRECFSGVHAVPTTAANVLGILSLVTWSLILVISVKYLALILRADNDGEGGILALMALATRIEGRAPHALLLLGLFGAALLYGDGMITPAISVLSAMEGISIATPALGHFVVPLTIAVLIGLFALQHRGTGSIGALFGPVTIAWFAVLAVLGAASLFRSPEVLASVDPRHAVRFFAHNGAHGFLTLGSVFLVVTGGEALYADMGHFGRRPIRIAWFALVLPALLLNYFGQGALLLREPAAAVNPFYHLAPSWALYPLVALATAATVIASQAIITGAFSLTWQAVQLGLLPRVRVVHTSEKEIGRIYIPLVNNVLLVSTVALVLGFETSTRLAAAYGVAVTGTMVITTILAFMVMRRLWNWSLLQAIAVAGVFLLMDLAFLASNLVKVADGGWFPLLIGTGVVVLMTTWRTGRRLLVDRLREQAMITFEELTARLESRRPVRVPGTGIYMTGHPEWVPAAVTRLLQGLNALHERMVFFTVLAERVPRIDPEKRLSIEPLGQGCFRVIARYGFLEQPHIPRAVTQCRQEGVSIDPGTAVYVLSPETIIASSRPGMALWRDKLFAFMARNAARPSGFFRLPTGRVLEVAGQVEL
jgi:KUP system potassium uptake protein